MRMIDNFRYDYFFLSNFFPHTMVVDDKTFITNEHFFQASKAQTTDDFEAVRNTSTPRDSKHMGRVIPVRLDWEMIKQDIMLKGLRVKFSDPVLLAKLLATEDATLVEGNTWHDQYWGRCDCTKHGGEGENWLGRMLMQIRDELRAARWSH